MQTIKSENTIRIKAGLISFDVYASDEDFDFVWDFIKKQCKNAKMVE